MMDQVNKGKNGVPAYGGQVEFNKSAIYGNKCTLSGNGQQRQKL